MGMSRPLVKINPVKTDIIHKLVPGKEKKEMMPRDALQALLGFSRERILICSLPRRLLLICPETQLYCLA